MAKTKTKTADQRRARRAYLQTDVVHVCCSECGEPQPNHDGSEQWQRADFAHVVGLRLCVSCDRPLLITPDPKATFV